MNIASKLSFQLDRAAKMQAQTAQQRSAIAAEQDSRRQLAEHLFSSKQNNLDSEKLDLLYRRMLSG